MESSHVYASSSSSSNENQGHLCQCHQTQSVEEHRPFSPTWTSDLSGRENAKSKDTHEIRCLAYEEQNDVASYADGFGVPSKYNNYSFEIIAGTSNQYSAGSPSACGIFAVEAAMWVVHGRELWDGKHVDQILRTASGYELEQHPYLEDVLKRVDRFDSSLQQVHFQQNIFDSFRQITELVRRYAKQINGVGVLVRPPEVVMLAYRTGAEYPWVMFDSHSREAHKSAAFLLFPTEHSLLRYLEQLFGGMEGAPGECAVHILKRSGGDGNLSWEKRMPANFERLENHVLKSTVKQQHEQVVELMKKVEEGRQRAQQLLERLAIMETKYSHEREVVCLPRHFSTEKRSRKRKEDAFPTFQPSFPSHADQDIASRALIEQILREEREEDDQHIKNIIKEKKKDQRRYGLTSSFEENLDRYEYTYRHHHTRSSSRGLSNYTR